MNIRAKLQSKYRGFGSDPPAWTNSGLGKADNDPDGLLNGLGLSGFRGKGDDGLHDIFTILQRAINSSILKGLYTNITKRERSGEIILEASPDLYRFGNGAVMLRFPKSILAAADKLGWIALPSGLSVSPTTARSGVIISWRGFVK
jgi:hypothetical protein